MTALRRWLTGALLCIVALPPPAVWSVHELSTSTAGPDAATLSAARAYAVDNVEHWTDAGWQTSARDYFTLHQADAELRPAHGSWFSTSPIAAGVAPADKFVVRAPDDAILGSGWVIPHTTTQRGWSLPLAAGALTLALTVAATGAFLGRDVVRPLAAMCRAAASIPRGEFDLRLPATHVSEVATVATALQTMSDDLHTALDRQADAEEQRRQFIGAIAHDLRTPLFTLRAYLDGLDDGLATTPQKADRYLQACRTSATALDRLITDLFAYARMEYLDEHPRAEQIDLSPLLRAAAQAQLPRADAKNIALTVTTPTAPCVLTGDEHLLTRVIDNLLDNALRHTPERGQIDVRCARTGAEVTFAVTDTGPGIAPADLPHLFAPLYRGEASRNRATGGAGLGLAIAHRIVAAHGGTLTAENAAPRGARFTARMAAAQTGSDSSSFALSRSARGQRTS